jgi:hypothetical protein
VGACQHGALFGRHVVDSMGEARPPAGGWAGRWEQAQKPGQLVSYLFYRVF